MPITEKRTLLIVDDEPEIREIIRIWAESDLNATVFEAENGKVALDLIREHQKNGIPIDAILSDINMAVMNGLEFMKSAREEGITIPIIVLTAHGDKKTTVTALQLGAYDFLDKPFNSTQLLKSLNSALDLGFSLRNIDAELENMVKGLNLSPEDEKKLKDMKRKLLVSSIKAQAN